MQSVHCPSHHLILLHSKSNLQVTEVLVYFLLWGISQTVYSKFGYCTECFDFGEKTNILVKKKQESLTWSFCSFHTIRMANGIDEWERVDHPLNYLSHELQQIWRAQHLSRSL